MIKNMSRGAIIALVVALVALVAGGASLLWPPRGGHKGFVKTADSKHLLLPDAGGNNRLDSFTNLISDPRIALIFFVPGVDETLRVNGVARLRDEPEFIQRFEGERQLPKLVIEIEVHEAYLHCSKAFMRSKLWSAETQIERKTLPTLNEIIHAQMGLTAAPETQEAMLTRYRAQIADEQGS